ncbi:MAG: hypothetical protein KJ847_02735 [Firmicutes bacterium]|nr:hypothetical protein [Bacillota bacterium]
MKKVTTFKQIKDYYVTGQIAKSFLLGFLFFLFPTILLSSFMVLSVLLSIYYLLYFLIGLFLLLIILSFFTNRITIKTLITYRYLPDIIDYNKLYVRLCVSSVFGLILLFVGISCVLYLVIL